MKIGRGLFLAITPALVAAANADDQARYEQAVQPIFDEHCVICHMTGSANAGLILEAGKSFENLVDVPSTESSLRRVSPGVPEKSYLVKKLTGMQIAAGGQGVSMPLGGAALTAEEMASIESWIRSLQPARR